MNSKILVTYASCTGYTEGIAEVICQTLNEHGFPSELCPMKEVKVVESYRAIIAGSAIQGRKWLPEAMNFLESYKEELSGKPFAAFMVCMTLGIPNGEKYRQGLKEWLEPVRRLVRPVSEGYFAGGLNIPKIPGLGNRIKFRLSVLMGVWKEGDHRDWKAINDWITEIEGYFC
jgi:menaquinone-dependent protoporphyrinogen IX oxidase